MVAVAGAPVEAQAKAPRTGRFCLGLPAGKAGVQFDARAEARRLSSMRRAPL
ncbi:Uncharacterised protein [Bordetella pertussis]|nr:Uncharacterised protein [Bordetella pertussis]